MTPQREDNYQVAEVSNVTAAAPNVSQQNAVNKIVINALDELLTIDDTRTIAPIQIFLVVVVIYLTVCIIIEALCPSLLDDLEETEDNIDESRLN